MNAKFLHPSAAGGAARKGHGSEPALYLEDLGGFVGDACCCPARPAVRVVMPPTASRRHTTELLLCGHHYRVSRAALAAAGATVTELPGTPEDVAAWVGVERETVPAGLG